MKKIILLLIICISSLFSFSQRQDILDGLDAIKDKWKLDNNGYVTIQKIVETQGMSKEAVYNRAYSYFVYNYGSGADVIQANDKEAGLIVGKGFYKITQGTGLSMVFKNFWHIVKVEIKEGRTRITVSLTQYDEYFQGQKQTWSMSMLYPLNQELGNYKRNVFGEFFIYAFRHAEETINGIAKSINEGELEDNNW